MQQNKNSIKAVSAALLMLLLSAFLLVSCAGGPSNSKDTHEAAGDGNEFTADSFKMTAGADWGSAVRIAGFEGSVPWEGIQSVEATLPYGETTVAWNFDGLEPGAPVRVSFDLWADCLMTDTFLAYSVMSGRWTAEDGSWPRDEIRDAMVLKWIDSVGRFAGELWPDMTEGWQTLTWDGVIADEYGEVSVILIVNHWSETPPIVRHYFTNPVVETINE